VLGAAVALLILTRGYGRRHPALRGEHRSSGGDSQTFVIAFPH
jgi:hypothetical protein